MPSSSMSCFFDFYAALVKGQVSRRPMAAFGMVFMDMQWGNLMRLARRAVNLTQEDFASDFSVSRSMVGHWEGGQKPIPQTMKRAILDLLNGYYKSRPEMRSIENVVNGFDGYSCVHFQEHRGLIGNKNFISRWNQGTGSDFLNANILSFLPSDSLVLRISEEYTLKMLRRQSEFAQITVFDKSVLLKNFFAKREITPINLGVGTILLVREKIFHTSETPFDKFRATAITIDGTEEMLIEE